MSEVPQQIPDLVRDSRLDVVRYDGQTGTTTQKCKVNQSIQRNAFILETWKKDRRIGVGQGSFARVWLEVNRDDVARLRARVVKEIDVSDRRLTATDFIRELEAIAKFSHEKVKHHQLSLSSALILMTSSTTTALLRHSAGLRETNYSASLWNTCVKATSLATFRIIPVSKRRTPEALPVRSWRD
jgi:hypothetical protein